MGVPGFFAWLLRNYKENNIVSEGVDGTVNTLYLDANCLFHPQCFKVLGDYYSTNVDKLEKMMINRIINYIDYLIDYVNPSNMVYISVDGVAPMAKMSQQRKRRYRSVDDNILKDNIKKKHGQKINTSWTNTVITPGTEFMEKLHRSIVSYIKKRKDKNINYSSYHTPGEGEHKILQHIKEKENPEDICVIYGLDADLIFLALATQRKNIYLLREAVHFGKPGKKEESLIPKEMLDIVKDVEEELSYVSIDNLRDRISKKMCEIVEGEDKFVGLEDDEVVGKLDKQDTNFLINDFIFICYLLGNDFLPHLPSVDIRTGGLDLLIGCYADIYNTIDQPLVVFKNKKVSINTVFLDMLLQTVSKREEYYFKEIQPRHFKSLERRRCPSDDPYDIEMWNLENMKDVDVENPIELGVGYRQDWKFKYYEYYFGVSEYQNELVFSMVQQYLTGLVWVAKYYFEKCPSWYWQYPYTHAPFISDISYMFNKFSGKMNKLKFDNSKPITPCTQLLAVLPPSCSDILPKSYRSLVLSSKSPVIDMYPKEVILDMLYKDSYFKCVPHIPNVEISRILDCTKQLKLTDQEKQRDNVLKDIKNR